MIIIENMIYYLLDTFTTSYNITHYIYHTTFYCMIWCVDYCASYHNNSVPNCTMCSSEYICANSTNIDLY